MAQLLSRLYSHSIGEWHKGLSKDIGSLLIILLALVLSYHWEKSFPEGALLGPIVCLIVFFALQIGNLIARLWNRRARTDLMFWISLSFLGPALLIQQLAFPKALYGGEHVILFGLLLVFISIAIQLLAIRLIGKGFQANHQSRALQIGAGLILTHLIFAAVFSTVGEFDALTIFGVSLSIRSIGEIATIIMLLVVSMWCAPTAASVLVWIAGAVVAALTLLGFAQAQSSLNSLSEQISVQTGFVEVFVAVAAGVVVGIFALLAKRRWVDGEPRSSTAWTRLRGFGVILHAITPLIMLAIIGIGFYSFVEFASGEATKAGASVARINKSATDMRTQAQKAPAALKAIATVVKKDFETFTKPEIEKLQAELERRRDDITERAKVLPARLETAVNDAKTDVINTGVALKDELAKLVTLPDIQIPNIPDIVIPDLKVPGFPTIEIKDIPMPKLKIPDLGLEAHFEKIQRDMEAKVKAYEKKFGKIGSDLRQKIIGAALNEYLYLEQQRLEVQARAEAFAVAQKARLEPRVNEVTEIASGLIDAAKGHRPKVEENLLAIGQNLIDIIYGFVIFVCLLAFILFLWFIRPICIGLYNMAVALNKGWRMLISGQEPSFNTLALVSK